MQEWAFAIPALTILLRIQRHKGHPQLCDLVSGAFFAPLVRCLTDVRPPVLNRKIYASLYTPRGGKAREIEKTVASGQWQAGGRIWDSGFGKKAKVGNRKQEIGGIAKYEL